MSAPLAILHTADSHIGADLPTRPRHCRPRRGHDFIESFRRVLRQAQSEGVDLVIHAGDLFDAPLPSAGAMAAAGEPLLELASAGIPIIIVPGNHERSAIPDCLFLFHRNIFIVTRPCTLAFHLRGTRVAVSALPCIRHDAARRFPAALEGTGWRQADVDLRILAVHQTIESAACGPANYRFRSGEDVIERDALPADFDYVACGHVHRHQKITPADGIHPPILYAGSPDRISFAELDEPKGFVLVKAENDQLVPHFVEHAVRPMAVIPIAVSGLTRSQIRAAAESSLAALPANATVQLRLTGVSTRSDMSDLRLGELARSLRPDVLLSVAVQGVEFDAPTCGSSQPTITESVFEVLDAPRDHVLRARIDELENLPTARGVYALFDARNRLLYVGKASNLRTRVQSHRNGQAKTNQYRGWTLQIARVEARRAHSDLEALLLEAELIRRLRPPFNQQMRRWMRYCYLVGDETSDNPLTVAADPGPHARCFGPFRSRQFATTLLEAVDHVFEHFDRHGRLCADPGHDDRLRLRDAFLSGRDDAALRVLEEAIERARPDEVTNRYDRLVALAAVLRSGFDHVAMLCEAEQLLGGLVIMPGPAAERRVAMLTAQGIRFATLDSRDDLDRFLIAAPEQSRENRNAVRGRLPKSIMDGLATAVRALRQASDQHSFIASSDAAGSGEAGILCPV